LPIFPWGQLWARLNLLKKYKINVLQIPPQTQQPPAPPPTTTPLSPPPPPAASIILYTINDKHVRSS